jgi:hypothetical protein
VSALRVQPEPAKFRVTVVLNSCHGDYLRGHYYMTSHPPTQVPRTASTTTLQCVVARSNLTSVQVPNSPSPLSVSSCLLWGPFAIQEPCSSPTLRRRGAEAPVQALQSLMGDPVTRTGGVSLAAGPLPSTLGTSFPAAGNQLGASKSVPQRNVSNIHAH